MQQKDVRRPQLRAKSPVSCFYEVQLTNLGKEGVTAARFILVAEMKEDRWPRITVIMLMTIFLVERWISSAMRKTLWITALSNSMKLWAMLYRVTQNGWVMVNSWTECGPIGKGMGNHFSILALRTPWTVWKGKQIWHWKLNNNNKIMSFSS